MQGCPKPSSSVLKNNIFHCGQGCLQPSSSKIIAGTDNLAVPLLLGGLFGGSWRLLGASCKKKHSSLDGPLGAGPKARGPSSRNPGPSRPLTLEFQGLVSRKPLLVRPRGWPEGPLAGRALLGPPWPRGAQETLGPGQGVLDRGHWLGGPWRGSLASGALRFGWPLVGALGSGRPASQNHKIEQAACLDPWPASSSRRPPGGPGKP